MVALDQDGLVQMVVLELHRCESTQTNALAKPQSQLSDQRVPPAHLKGSESEPGWKLADLVFGKVQERQSVLIQIRVVGHVATVSPRHDLSRQHFQTGRRQ